MAQLEPFLILDPNYVSYQYVDGDGDTEEASSWQPGSLRFYLDDTYTGGSFLTQSDLVISQYDDFGFFQEGFTLDTEGLIFRNVFGPLVELDQRGLNVTNSASWPAFNVNIRGIAGQLDLYTGHNNNFIARLGSTSENSDHGSLTLYDETGDRKVRVEVDDFEEGVVQTYGANGTATAILGSVFGSNDGGLFLTSSAGHSNMTMLYDANNKGVVTSNFFVGEDITINADDSGHSAIFHGGKGVRMKSTGNATPDLTLEANSADEADGYISSDPNYDNSNLIFRSNGSIVFRLDDDESTPGLHPFVVFDNNMDFRVTDDAGMSMQKLSTGVSEPHITIRDLSSNNYGRLNIGNTNSQKWQIAGKPTGSSTQKYLLFHLTDTDGSTGDDLIQLRGDGNAFIEGTWAPISDIRLKKDIVPVKNSLEKISSISGYDYNWKDPNKPLPQTGVIAQEVQKVFPNLVVANNEGNLSVNYDGLIPHLIESVKELKAEIEQLKAQLKE